MGGVNQVFNANEYEPSQGGGGGGHPVGENFPATISKTEIKGNKENTGGFLAVEFTTPAGKIVNRYNMWSQSPDAVRIACEQLSALCHATGVMNVDMNNEGAALINARCYIDVAKQGGDNPKGYVEVSKVKNAQTGQAPGDRAAPSNGGTTQGGPGAGGAPFGGGNAPGGNAPQNTGGAGGWGGGSPPAAGPQGGNQGGPQGGNAGGGGWGGGGATQQAQGGGNQGGGGGWAPGGGGGNTGGGSGPWGGPQG